MSPGAFRRVVARALDAIPEQFQPLLNNVVIVVEDEPTPALRDDMGLVEGEELFGLYDGVSLLDRGFDHVGLPDRVVIYRLPLLRAFPTRSELIEEIQRTVVHEIGHHMGLSDDEMVF